MIKFNYSSSLSKINASDYLKYLKGAARRVTTRFEVCGLYFKDKEFPELLAASASYCKIVCFNDWFIDVDTNMCFQSIKKSKMRSLYLNGTEFSNDSIEELHLKLATVYFNIIKVITKNFTFSFD